MLIKWRIEAGQGVKAEVRKEEEENQGFQRSSEKRAQRSRTRKRSPQDEVNVKIEKNA